MTAMMRGAEGSMVGMELSGGGKQLAPEPHIDVSDKR